MLPGFSLYLPDGWPHKVCELKNAFGDVILVKVKKSKKESIYLEFSNQRTMRTIATSSCLKLLDSNEIKEHLVDASKRAVRNFKC